MKPVCDITDPRIGFNNKARTQYGMPYCVLAFTANNNYSLRNDDFVTHQKAE